MRVAVADDSALFRSGLVRVLKDAGIEVTDEAQDGTRLLELINAHPPDVAIVDIRMPPTMRNEGLAAAHEIRKRYPDVGVLILSTYVETDFAYALISESRERVGYLLKDHVSDVDELVEAIHRIARGGSVIEQWRAMWPASLPSSNYSLPPTTIAGCLRFLPSSARRR